MKNKLKCKIIKASAGTGKTYTMALEYIRKLNEGVNFEDIVVITFTRKATAEIRERLIKFLEIIVLKKEKHEELEKNISSNINYNLLKKSYENMIKNAENINIYTIDAFIKNIFNQLIAPIHNIYNYEISNNNNEEHYNEIYKEISSNAEYMNIFEDLFYKYNKNKNLESFNSLLENMLANRSKIYNKNLVELKSKTKYRKYDEILNEIKETIKQLTTSEKDLNKPTKNLLTAKSKKEFFDAIKKINNISNRGKIKELEEYFENVKIEIYDLYFHDELIPYNKAYLRLANLIYKLDIKIKFKKQNFTLSDLAFYISTSDNDIKAMYNKIDTIMVDEFQDTDPMQFNVIMKLSEVANNLLLVGDAKQAIYSFRGGDYRLFENIEQEILKYNKNIELEYKTLDTSYRSTKNIIEYVNNYFSNIENFNYENVNYVLDNGFVEIRKSENIEQSIAEDIFLNKDEKNVAILTSKNAEMPLFANELEKYSLKINIDQSTEIQKDKKSSLIVKLIDYLVYDNKISLLEFMRSDLSCYKLNTCIDILRGKKLDEIEKLKDFNNDFKENYLKLYSYGKNAQLSDKLNILKLLDMINESKSLKDFLDNYNLYIKEMKIENALEDNGINIMTIHKSKGLEFDTVYLPYKKKKATTFSDYVLHEKDEEIILLKNKSLLSTSCYEYLFNEYLENEERESNNRLYVALTRAKNNLIIYVDEKNSEYLEKTIGIRQSIQEKEYKEIDSLVKFNNKEFFDKNSFDTNIVISNIEKEQSRKMGLAVHYFMENYKKEKDYYFAYTKFLKKYGNLIGPKYVEMVLEKIKYFTKEYSKIFNENHTIYTEYEIFDENNNRFIIDRLNIDEKNKIAYIYEYKTLKDAYKNEDYIKQVENYKQILSKKLENYKIYTEILSV